LLAHYPEVTAVCCANDLIALGVMAAAGEYGRQVGRDLSVVGFDDIFIAGLVTPALTTVRQPIARLGAEAARLAVDAIGGSPAASSGQPKRVVLPVELVVRDSTARIAPPRDGRIQPVGARATTA